MPSIPFNVLSTLRANEEVHDHEYGPLVWRYNSQNKQSKTARSPTHDTSPSHTVEDEVNLRDRVSMSSPISDLEDYDESPPITWERDRDEGTFIWVLDQLSSIEFDLPLSYPFEFANSVGELTRAQRSLGIVLPCSSLISIFNSKILRYPSNSRCEFLDGAAFLLDLKAGVVQPSLINAMCAVSARHFLS